MNSAPASRRRRCAWAIPQAANEERRKSIMGRTCEVLEARLTDELAAFGQAAAEGMRGNFLGSLLQFRKGTWIHGEQKAELPDGTELVAVMTEFRRGYVKWSDKKAVEHLIGKIVDGFTPPDRERLGDNDPSCWPIGLSGEREDPWRFTLYAPLCSPDGEEIFTFAASSHGAQWAVNKLMARYAKDGRAKGGLFPVVALATETYEHPRFGPISKPRFDIVGWAGRPALYLGDGGTQQKIAVTQQKDDLGATSAGAEDELNDDVPF
jgi:hypothetical protein